MDAQPWEKDWANNILYLEKNEAKTLCSLALECTNDQVRNHAVGILNRSLENQKVLFDIMKYKGWYNVEAAPQEQFTRTQQSFSSLQSGLQQI